MVSGRAFDFVIYLNIPIRHFYPSLILVQPRKIRPSLFTLKIVDGT